MGRLLTLHRPDPLVASIKDLQGDQDRRIDITSIVQLTA